MYAVGKGDSVSIGFPSSADQQAGEQEAPEERQRPGPGGEAEEAGRHEPGEQRPGPRERLR